MGNNKVIYSGKLTVRYSMYDFINAVRERPIIWNRKHPQFHMREKRENAWHEVGNNVSREFAAATPEDKEKMVNTLVKRWKNTRDCFLRSLRAKDSKDCDYSRRYIYDNELAFLLTNRIDADKIKREEKNLRKRKAISLPVRSRSMRSSVEAKKSRNQTNVQSDFDTEFENLCLDVGDIVKELSTADSPDPTTPTVSTKTTTATTTTTANGKMVAIESSSIDSTERQTNDFDVEKQVEEELELNEHKLLTPTSSMQNLSGNYNLNSDQKKNSEFMVEEVDTDADQCFFDSIKPMMRSLSIDKKLDFQIEVLKLLKHFRSN